MTAEVYTVDLREVGRLRKMTNEFLERGLCLVRSLEIPPADTTIQVVLLLPGGVRFPVEGFQIRSIEGKGFVLRIDPGPAARLTEDIKALLSVTAPEQGASQKDEELLAKALPKRPSNLVGQVLDDKYQITRLLGQGGMGEVYQATHRYLEKTVALKVLLPELARDSSFVTRFLREARSVAGLCSPHTVTVHDFGVTDDGILYFTMELLEGSPLTQVIADHAPLPFSRAAHLLLQACASLQEAHECGLLHRDLKPDNLFVTRGPNGAEHVTLLDFGIAKPIEGGERLTVTGTICGTPHYLSPEQAQGKTLDPRSDLYSLGVLLYEMLTGVCPFEADNTVAVLMKQLQEIPPALALAYPDLRIHPLVDDLLADLLSKDPDSRPESAQILADRIRGIAARTGVALSGEAASPPRSEAAAVAMHHPPRPRPKPAPPAREPATPGAQTSLPPWLGYALAAVGLVAVILLLWRPWASQPDELAPPPSKQAAAMAPPVEDHEYEDEAYEPSFPRVARAPWDPAVMAPAIRAEDPEDPLDDEEEPEDEPTAALVEPGDRHYVRLSLRQSFCRHLVTLTAREWAVEDPAYNRVLAQIRSGPSAYPDPLRSIYDDCLDGFLRRNITEDEVRCTLDAGSLAEVEVCGR